MIIFLTPILVTRVFFLLEKESAVSLRRALLAFSMNSFLFILFFQSLPEILYYVLAFALLWFMTWICERILVAGKDKDIFWVRFVEFLVIIGVVSVVGNLNLSIGLPQNIQMIKYVMGLCVVTLELNYLIRILLNKISFTSSEDDCEFADKDKIDNRELRRGLYIGILERVLFYHFVIMGQLGAIGFVLAAKGFTRYKELNDKNFAEYVLIGTLISAAVSVLWASFVKHYILG